MTDYYDAEVARLFKVFGDDHAIALRPWLERVLPPVRPGATAVDIGCGSGRWTGLLLDHYDRVSGVDPGPEQVKLAAEAHPEAAFAVAGLMDMDGTDDVVLCVNVLHAVKDPGALPHLRSLVAPGGTLIVCDVTQDSNAKHVWNTIEGQLDDAFQDARESYEERSQDYTVAADVLKLHLHPLWLKHCYEDVPLTRAEFIAQYGAVFPGANFTEVHRVQTGMVWHAGEQRSP